MKARTKLLVSTTAMLVLSAGAMVTGTVAWFTAVRQANVTFSNVKVISTEGDLLVSYEGTKYTFDDATPGQLDITGTDIITDISGDGMDFYKPAFTYSNPSSLAALYINDVSANTDDAFYVEFQLKISRTNYAETNGFLVYLGSNSVIEPFSLAPADVAAAKAARVAILDDAGTTRKILWAPETGDAAYEYIVEDAMESLYDIDGYTTHDAETDSDFLVGSFTNHTEIDGLGGHQGGNSPVIADLSTAEDEIITLRMWLEGLDEDCINDARNGFFTLTLDIYAMGL